MMLAHHGLGEELVLYAVGASGAGAASALLALARARVGGLMRQLRRR